MQHSKTMPLPFFALFCTLMLVLSLTPLGFIPLGPFSVTTLHIPVLIVALLYGPLYGALSGSIFGLLSFFQALLRPSISSVIFMNPIVAFLPRVALGFIAGSLFATFLYSWNWQPTKAATWAMAGASLTHTCFVLSLAGVFYHSVFGTSVFSVVAVLLLTFLINGISEVVAVLLIGMPLIRILYRMIQKKKGL